MAARKKHVFRNRNRGMEKIATAALREAIDKAGSQVKLASLLKIERASVQQWTRHGGCPIDRIVEVERATGVKRQRLAPELFVPA
jgi:DNA-binding transcriptional regulator YdaS (Cro superfamily)